MYFAPFREEFEELGFKETRCVFAGKSLDFPEGEYCFEELFCVEPFCDCRIVRFIVMNQEGKEQAQITWGWEKKSFYDKEFGFSDHNFPGPDLAAMAPQGPYALSLLDILKTVILKDSSYKDRIKTHYDLFKEARQKKAALQVVSKGPSIGRNELCSCGSNKKAKKCCF